jgi:hypothetical protein
MPRVPPFFLMSREQGHDCLSYTEDEKRVRWMNSGHHRDEALSSCPYTEFKG